MKVTNLIFDAVLKEGQLSKIRYIGELDNGEFKFGDYTGQMTIGDSNALRAIVTKIIKHLESNA